MLESAAMLQVLLLAILVHFLVFLVSILSYYYLSDINLHISLTLCIFYEEALLSRIQALPCLVDCGLTLLLRYHKAIPWLKSVCYVLIAASQQSSLADQEGYQDFAYLEVCLDH